MKITKKAVLFTAAASLALAAFTSVSADDSVKVLLNGSELSFDVPPQIIEERTMVPLRAIFEAMGAEVDWDGATQTVAAVKDDITVKMIIGNADMSRNDEVITLDVPPQIVDDRTLVPARAVAESFGAEVDWDGAARTVLITTSEDKAEEAPAPTAAPAVTPTAAPTASGSIPIEYDVDSTSSSSVKSFKIVSYTTEANGDYNISYTFETYLEGPGSVSANFDCLDAAGKVIATIGGMYKTVDYQLTPQKDTAIIPPETVKIVLSGN